MKKKVIRPLLQRDTDISPFLAFYSHTSGWYLPAAGELMKLHEQREKVEKTFDIIIAADPSAAKKMNKHNYWTSSERTDIHVWLVNSSGNLGIYDKVNNCGVRAIRAF